MTLLGMSFWKNSTCSDRTISLFPVSAKQPAVERAVLDCFTDVFGLDVFAFPEVGDRAGNFQDSVVGACAQVELFHGIAQHFLRGRIELAKFFDLAVAHFGIAGSFPSLGESCVGKMPTY